MGLFMFLTWEGATSLFRLPLTQQLRVLQNLIR